MMVTVMSVACTETFDDSAIWNKLNNLEGRIDRNEDRIKALEEALENYNADMESIQSIVEALQKNLYIERVSPTSSGTVIVFSDGSVAVINNGKDGKDGKDGEDGKDGADGKDGMDGKNAPVIGIGLYNGQYYWTQTIDGKTSWLLDDYGNKVPTGNTPLLDIDDYGYWTVSYDNGRTYSRFFDAYGNPVKAAGEDGDTFFKSVTVVGDELYIELADGSEFVIPLGSQSVYKAVDLGLGVRWATFNVGATSPSETGIYFYWGDVNNTGVAPYYEAPNQNSICGTEYDIARHSWGGTWRMPTQSEQIELINRCQWSSSTVNGVQGCKVIGPNGNHIFLPLTGYRLPASGVAGTTQLSSTDYGYYWSAESYYDANERFGKCMYFNTAGKFEYWVSYNVKIMKMVVRPVKE